LVAGAGGRGNPRQRAENIAIKEPVRRTSAATVIVVCGLSIESMLSNLWQIWSKDHLRVPV